MWYFSIAAGRAEPFAVALCDLNGLKHVNDTRGHKAGDLYLRDGCLSICHVFKHSPVYRIGGDEFAVVLEGHDLENVEALMRQLQDDIDRNVQNTDRDDANFINGIGKNGNELISLFDVNKIADEVEAA